MPYEVHKDTDPLATGTQKCRTWLLSTLSDPGKDFKSCGVVAGLAVRNTTDGSAGVAASVTDDYMTVTLTGGSLNVWTSGDTYEIYKTGTYNSKISSIYVDNRYGRKVSSPSELTESGYFPEDVDLDENNEKVFGPGQPSKNLRGY
jgi:hypothetical protein